jgi:hypothetical protein
MIQKCLILHMTMKEMISIKPSKHEQGGMTLNNKFFIPSNGISKRNIYLSCYKYTRLVLRPDRLAFDVIIIN